MTNYELVFFYDLPANKQAAVSPIFFFNWEMPYDKSFTKKIELASIKEIQRRRFLGMKTALELFLMNNKQVLLNFPTMELRNDFAKKILRQRKIKCKNLRYYTSLDPKWILKKKLLTEDWINWKISNFEYIMQLNLLAGRSFNDLSQYPVFPWIFNSYNNDKVPEINAVN